MPWLQHELEVLSYIRACGLIKKLNQYLNFLKQHSNFQINILKGVNSATSVVPEDSASFYCYPHSPKRRGLGTCPSEQNFQSPVLSGLLLLWNLCKGFQMKTVHFTALFPACCWPASLGGFSSFWDPLTPTRAVSEVQPSNTECGLKALLKLRQSFLLDMTERTKSPLSTPESTFDYLQ